MEDGFVCEIFYRKDNHSVIDKNDQEERKTYIHGLPDRETEEHFYSVCSWDGAVALAVRRIQKDRFANSIEIELWLEPYLHAYK